MSSEITALAIAERQESYLALEPVMGLELAMQRLEEFQKFVNSYLREGEDYGAIPGTKKPTLFKPGADKLCELYGLTDTYPDERLRRTEEWDRTPPLFDYEVTCVLTSRRTGQVVSEGKGSCNSYEGKYKWREMQRVCPSCGKEAIIPGKPEYSKGKAGFENGGWLCWKKKDGCGQQFQDDDPQITSQAKGKVVNDDIATLKNTILKMAKKRAKIDATLSATRSSGIFTQDVEDMVRANETGVKALPVEDDAGVYCKVCGDDVTSLQEVKDTKADFGKVLCRICARKERAKKPAQQDTAAALKKSIEIVQDAKESGIPIDFNRNRK